MNITPEDILQYCNTNKTVYLAHGTTTDNIDSFKQDGLAINRDKLDYPTVTFWTSGVSKNGEERIVDYKWVEPHSYNGENTSCCVIFEVPKEVISGIIQSGEKVSQKSIFERICRQKIMTVPDCEFTREAYAKILQEDISIENSDDLGLRGLPSLGPKYCTYGAEPNSPFVGFGVPPQYILATTTGTQVYYAGSKLKNYISERDGLNEHFEDEPIPSDDNINQQFIEAYLDFVKSKTTSFDNESEELPDEFPFTYSDGM